MPIIYHATTAAEWDTAKKIGFYKSSSFKEEGFIHCSHAHQIAGVLERYFAGKTNLVKLVIDTDKLTSRFVFEWSPSTADTFPHVYGAINTDAVEEVVEIN